MPKFLDQPSWYVNVSGTPKQVWGAPMAEEFDNSLVQNGDILSKQVQGGFSCRNLRVNGSNMSDIDIYAPKEPGALNALLLGSGSSSEPPYWIGPPSSSGYYLTSGNGGKPQWSAIPSTPYTQITRVNTGTNPGTPLYFNKDHTNIGAVARNCIIWGGVVGGTITSINFLTTMGVSSSFAPLIEGCTNFWFTLASASGASSRTFYYSGMMSKGTTVSVVSGDKLAVTSDVNAIRIVLSSTGYGGTAGIISF